MHAGAMLVEKLWSDGKRLRPRAVVAEFEKTLRDELDLTREAANCSQLRAQLRALAAPARPRGALGLLRHRSDGDGADDRHPDRPGGPAARGRRRHPAARPRRRRGVLHAGVPRRLLPRRHAPGQHLRRHGRAAPRQVHRRRLRHHGHARPERDQSYLAAELPRVLPPRLPSRRDRASRIGLGAADTRVDELEAEIRVVLEPASSTGRSRRSRSGACCCSSSARRAGSTSRSSRSSCSCRRRCSTSKASAGSSIPTSTCG